MSETHAKTFKKNPNREEVIRIASNRGRIAAESRACVCRVLTFSSHKRNLHHAKLMPPASHWLGQHGLFRSERTWTRMANMASVRRKLKRLCTHMASVGQNFLIELHPSIQYFRRLQERDSPMNPWKFQVRPAPGWIRQERVAA